MPGVSGLHRVRGRDNRTELRCDLRSADVPLGGDAQGVDQLVGADRRVAEERPRATRISRNAVNLLDCETGLGERLPNRVRRQKQGMTC